MRRAIAFAMQPYVTFPLLVGPALCMIAMAVSSARVLFISQKFMPGWTHLSPGPMHWFSGFGGIAISLFVFYIWAIVGSGRQDAAEQMKIAYWSAMAFGLCGSYAAHYISVLKRRNFRWQNETLAYEDRQGVTRTSDLSKIAVSRRNWKGEEELVFDDGTVAAIDPYTRHFGALIFQIAAIRNPPAPRPRPPRI